ncbi:MAG: putative hydrolase or acyltransferase of alpha/beta superfamily [Planctomycetota bacterium]|nr:putative hydrolase or acyltransferase of alpha/beta superfamily [Planctomycetota bacterium]
MLLNFEDDGPGPVVLLLHGLLLDHSMWDAQLGTIGSMYRVIAPDLRGHGKSAAPEGIYPVDDLANDVIELLDALRITEPIVIGGLSMGGYVALSIAVRFPKRLRGLMLMNTRAGADAPETAQVREDLAREVDRTGDVEPVVATMLPRLFAAETRRARPDLIEESHRVMSRTPARAVSGTLRGLAVRPDRTADLGRIKIPTMVLAGVSDALIPMAESRAMANGLPSAELVVIPDSGHLAPMENPTAANSAILRFLGSLA